MTKGQKYFLIGAVIFVVLIVIECNRCTNWFNGVC